jgi:hypothetical protein
MSKSGSPKCNCSSPEPCLCALKITDGKSTLVDYPNKKTTEDIYLHDVDGTGVPLDITLESKCPVNPAQCPSGILYEKEDFAKLIDIAPGNTKQSLKYNRPLTAPDPVQFFNAVLCGDLKDIPSTDYQLDIGQCKGVAPAEHAILSNSGKRETRLIGISETNHKIRVFPQYLSQLSFSLAVETKEQQEERSTNLKIKSLAEKIDASGSLTFNLADNTKVYESKELTERFTAAKNKLDTLTQAEDALIVMNSMFGSTTTGQAPIADCSFRPPKLSATGKCELALAKDNTPYFSHSIELGLTPLIGFTLKLNLLQALAAYLGVGAFASYIEQKASELEKEFKNNENAAYAGVKLELSFDSDFNFTYKVESKNNKNKEKEIELTLTASQIEIKITVDTNIRAGVKYMLLEGVFEIGAQGSAKGFLEIQQVPNNKLEGIFYHNGVTAKVYVEASFGRKEESKRTGTASNEGEFSTPSETSATNSNTTTSSSAKENLTLKTWTIYDKLSKEQSKFKVSLT